MGEAVGDMGVAAVGEVTAAVGGTTGSLLLLEDDNPNQLLFDFRFSSCC